MKHSMEAAGERNGMRAMNDSLMVDSAISHCEKLRRVLELEDWIREARDHPILARAAERWQEERDQLIAELEIPH